ncbi:MAG: SDR family NAD(P)-dependent oxidoreductase, partial [Alphaproteobacteria bacterium]|nr:SDR family NAD(P)-dependent oxidoreductase [Alphaproteobacteria bacterium]
MNQSDLRNRRAVVTGGAQGIGLAIADRLLRSGAAVALWDMNADLLKDAARKLAAAGKVAGVRCDVTAEASVSAAVAETTSALGGIDILVNNAGIAGPNMPLWEYPPDEWDRIMAINLRGVYLCCRAVVPAMRAQPFGRIVNIASI